MAEDFGFTDRDIFLLHRAREILVENGMLEGSTVVRNGRGSSAGNPIVISDVEDYTALEYALLFFLVQGKRYDCKMQYLMEGKDGRHLDVLTISSWDDPDGKKTEEDFYFDITAGFNAL